jgi:hypothetical protein
MTNTQPISEFGGPDRFFVARVDGKETLFVVHAADHSICIASSQPVTVIEPAEKILDELVGLAA